VALLRARSCEDEKPSILKHVPSRIDKNVHAHTN
jgi:hypothetical protein